MKIHGIKVPHRKHTADLKPVRLTDVKTITVPMSMHIGKPARAVVKRGDAVKVGQLIGEADGFVSSPIYSGVSGKVLKIDEMTASNGAGVPCVVIENDGQNEVSESVKPPEVSDFQSFIEAVKQSGVVGLGGAGFPTFIKLGVKDVSQIREIIINAAECEPYITSDTRTMLDKPEYIFKGIELLKKYLKAKTFIIGIENNKREAIELMQKKAAQCEGVSVKVLPSIYPQGGEKVLIYNTVGRIVPKGKLPIDVGVIVINVTTLAFIAEYMETGMPLVEKCLTFDGSAVKEPKNVIVPIGTSISELAELAGGFKCEPKKVLYGGPMMGIAVPGLDAPILKNTNAITALDEKDGFMPKTTPCINCGACLSHCPLRLEPREISRAYSMGNAEELAALHVDLCMECGCCSFICPANRPLVQNNKLAKALLRMKQSEQKKEGK